MSAEKTITVATLRVPEAMPVGMVREGAESAPAGAPPLFAGWHRVVQPALDDVTEPRFAIVPDELLGHNVLEQCGKADTVLFAGDDDWRTCTVTVRLRPLAATTLPGVDDERNVLARNGILFRCRTVRRGYLFCLEAGGERVVLYRRRDEEWTVLGSAPGPVDRSRYSELRVETRSPRIRCCVDGQTVIETADEMFPAGRCGLRLNSRVRLDMAEVSMPEKEAIYVRACQKSWETHVARARRRFPPPRLWKEVPLGACHVVWIGKLPDRPGSESAAALVRTPEPPTVFVLDPSPGRKEPLPLERGNLPFVLRAVNVSGDTLWRCETRERVPTPEHIVVGDFTGRETLDVAAVLTRKLVVIESGSGALRAERELPPPAPFDACRGGKPAAVRLFAVQLQPRPAPCGLLLCEDVPGGAHSAWAYDAALNPLWELHMPAPVLGRFPWFADVDGDGAEEILLGWCLLDHDGKLLRVLNPGFYADRTLAGRCGQNGFLGRLAGADSADWTSAHAGAGEGLVLADALSGNVRAQRYLGNVQQVVAGRFRPELAGRQIWAANGAGNAGIYTLVDAAGTELHQVQIEFATGPLRKLRWGPDGQELLFLQHSPASLGFWDGAGLKVVELPAAAQGRTWIVDACDDEQQELAIAADGKLRIYTQGTPA
jgi:hypothetical protein